MIKFSRVSLLATGIMALCLTASAQKKKDYTPYVNPFIGTDGEGHTFPGAVLPYGMLQVGPVTDLKSDTSKSSNGLTRYHYTDSIVYGFAYTHLSGINGPDGCDILFMPTTGKPEFAPNQYGSTYIKKNEAASPGYYKTKVDKYNIDIELTATTRAGMQQYYFPSGVQANIIIDLRHRVDVFDSSIEIVNDHEIRGFLMSGSQPLYFYTKFSKSFKNHGILTGRLIQTDITNAEKGEKIYVQFDNPGEIISKTGISAVSTDGALKNLDAEIPDFDFKKIQKAAKTAWVNELSKIEVEGGAPSVQQEQQQLSEQQGFSSAKPVKKTPVIDYGKVKRTIFYTALYHSMLSPNVYSDVDGQYPGFEKWSFVDDNTHDVRGFTYYSVFTSLARQKTQYPLLTLIDHKRTTDLIRSFLSVYENKDSLTRYNAISTYSAIGFQLIPTIIDAYSKGVRDFDAPLALDAMKYTQEHNFIAKDNYIKTGFKYSGWVFCVSSTLQFAYNDWCIAQMAKMLNKPVDYKEYTQRAQYWKNVNNKINGFMQPRKLDDWVLPFDPNKVSEENYAETNGWQYAFSVQQDVDGLIYRIGGKDRFAAKLDELFTTPSSTNNTKLIGEYNHGYWAAHHAPYLYNFTDQADKTQFYINKILNEQYTDKPDGLPGNDDRGLMSSWYVMSALGIYNIAPGQQQFQVGLPQFERAVINLENGKKFTILNSGSSVARNNIYLQGMSLNKKSYNKLYLNYDDIANGGEFEVYTGRLANKMFMHDLEKPTSVITDELIVPNPTITLLKTFAPPTQVSINSNDIEPNTIYYTIDGSVPTTSSMVYSKPIPVSSKTVIKAIAVKNGRSSFVTEAHY